MISLNAAAGYVYPGDDIVLTAIGSPNATVDLLEQSDRILGIIPVRPDYVVATHISDASGKTVFHVTVQKVSVVVYYVHQNCLLGVCDQSNTAQVSVIARPVDGTPTPGVTYSLSLSADKVVAKAGDTITFRVTGTPGTQVRLMHRIPTGDAKISDITLDVTGKAQATYSPPAQNSYVFYVETGDCNLWGALNCLKSNEVTISVTEGPCAAWDLGCQLSGGDSETGESFTAWLGETGKIVVLLVVVLVFIYIIGVYVLPGALTSAAAGAVGGKKG